MGKKKIAIRVTHRALSLDVGEFGFNQMAFVCHIPTYQVTLCTVCVGAPEPFKHIGLLSYFFCWGNKIVQSASKSKPTGDFRLLNMVLG